MGADHASTLDDALDTYLDDLEEQVDAETEQATNHAERVEAGTVTRDTIIARLRAVDQEEARSVVRTPVQVNA